MKISDIHQQANTMQQVNQTNPSNQPEKHQNSQEVRDKLSSTDKVEISAQSRERQKIYDLIQTTPDVRAEKVATIKKMIQEGNYQVDNDAVAEKLIEESILDLVK
jgi:negative regulator of flagellin synthesis FlgM